MKYRLLLLVVLMLGIYADSMAQFNGTGFSGGLGFGATRGNVELVSNPRFIARGFLRKGLTENFQLEAGVASAKIGGDLYNTMMFPIDLRLNISPFNFESWNPFIYGGYGVVNYNVEEKPVRSYAGAKLQGWAALIPFGAGIQMKFLDKANFEVVAGYTKTNSWDLDATRKTWHHSDNYWSLLFNLSSNISGVFDTDGDLLSDEAEKELGTDPKLADTDGDGLNDGDEVNLTKTSPKVADSDADGLNDKQETAEYKTDANVADTDGDGLSDGDEALKFKTDVAKKDTDGDKLADGEEVNKYKTDPLKNDTDGGTIADGDEVARCSNPVLASDDVVKEEVKAPEPVKEEKYAEIGKMETGTTLVLEGILFETGKATISPESETTLEGVATTLKNNLTLELEVQGHTDSKGSEATNKKLSQKRANAVRDYLIAKGVDGARLKAKGYGSAKPVDSNDTDEGRAKNRRIEFLRIK